MHVIRKYSSWYNIDVCGGVLSLETILSLEYGQMANNSFLGIPTCGDKYNKLELVWISHIFIGCFRVFTKSNAPISCPWAKSKCSRLANNGSMVWILQMVTSLGCLGCLNGDIVPVGKSKHAWLANSGYVTHNILVVALSCLQSSKCKRKHKIQNVNLRFS